MTTIAFAADILGRVDEGVIRVVDGLTADELAHRPGPEANPIAWLVWHLLRVQDDHLADLVRREQVYTEQGFAVRFNAGFLTPRDPADHGYGDTDDQVAAVRAEAGLLIEYARAVADRTREILTLGVRLASVIVDVAAHTGQADYVRGLLRPRGEGPGTLD